MIGLLVRQTNSPKAWQLIEAIARLAVTEQERTQAQEALFGRCQRDRSRQS